MNRTEHDIDRVLQGLRQAEPDPAMEHRILLALDHHASKPRTRLWSRLPPWQIATAAALLAVAIFLTTTTSHVPHASTAPQIAIAPPTPPAPTASPANTPHPHPHQPSTPRYPHPQPAVATLPSHPAPEPPLTDEERLLLRIARHATPEAYDILNPDARDARASAERSEFLQFFDPPQTETRPQ